MNKSKIIKIGFSFFFLALVSLAIVPFQKFAPLTNLEAAVHLPEELHPDYAPEINVASKNDTQGVEIIYANAILQFMAGGLLYLAGPVAILMIAVSGLRYVTSHGNESMMEGAKKTLTYAVIGLIIIILSFAIIKAIISVVVSTG